MRKGELDGVNLGRFEGVEAIFLPSFGPKTARTSRTNTRGKSTLA